MSVKIVTKMIVNRLKLVLRDMIALNQASFISGRQGIDNVIICQKLVHLLRYIEAKRGA